MTRMWWLLDGGVGDWWAAVEIKAFFFFSWRLETFYVTVFRVRNYVFGPPKKIPLGIRIYAFTYVPWLQVPISPPPNRLLCSTFYIVRP